uniref:Uncharacterized protein n=1 Tax=Micrurus corallinus TaxID=54390 RepID=A0A2D4GZ49_MICCO
MVPATPIPSKVAQYQSVTHWELGHYQSTELERLGIAGLRDDGARTQKWALILNTCSLLALLQGSQDYFWNLGAESLSVQQIGWLPLFKMYYFFFVGFDISSKLS